jgi:hypothetical protein
MPRRKPPVIADALLDQLLDGADARTAFETDGLLDKLKKALAERALNAEMNHHLVHGEPGNSRHGYGRKRVTTDRALLAAQPARTIRIFSSAECCFRVARQMSFTTFSAVAPLRSRSRSRSPSVLAHLHSLAATMSQKPSAAQSPQTVPWGADAGQAMASGIAPPGARRAPWRARSTSRLRRWQVRQRDPDLRTTASAPQRRRSARAPPIDPSDECRGRAGVADEHTLC